MNDEIRALIDSLRRGEHEDPAERISLLAAGLREHSADTALFSSLLNAPQVSLRLAVLEACLGRANEDVRALLIRLTQDRESRVRAKVCELLDASSDPASIEALRTLIADKDGEVRTAALKATSGRPAFLEAQRAVLPSEPYWGVRLEAVKSLGAQRDDSICRDLLIALANESDSDVQQQCAEILEQRLAANLESAEKHLPTDIALLNKAERALKALTAKSPALATWLQSHTTSTADPQVLARFGTNLTPIALAGTLPRAFCVAGASATVLKLMQREPWKSVVLLGESGVGKSALVNELVYALAKPENGGWLVLRVSPTDFMAGTKYTGEWETKVRELVEAVRRPRRVLLYIPNLADLAAMGKWSKSDANVATALAPYMEDGSILVLGECTAEEFERGFGAIPSIQRMFEKVLLPEAGIPETRAVLRGICDEARATMTDEVLAQLQEVSDYFLNHLRRPGNAATLLRAVLGAQSATGKEIPFRTVLDALSQSSGVPAKLLDDNIPLDGEEIRAFFDKRIMGQPEAVNAVVDLVTLIKAGLTDPNKPFGVMLFVGPTGVGKTELARALAEYIFGDVKRLLRFDMSEYSSPESYQRLIGGRSENGLLTDAIRQQPFSVVLLDEIEKSHVNVFDLCLQIFDAGRLTDGLGRMVDFRRTIVILTSNIGAQPPGTPLGFGTTTQSGAPTLDQDKTWRELTRFFRPEFLNRIDRIVNFRPLSIEVAEQIARREVESVLQRSGVARRGLTVHVDPSVTALLVREGYSPFFGARPLKRTVEQQLLIALARTIAAGHAQGRDVLTVTVESGKIVLRKLAKPKPQEPTRKSAEKSDTTLGEKAAALQTRCVALDSRLEPLRARKSQLLEETSVAGFYKDSQRSAGVFDEIKRLDQFLELSTSLRRGVESVASQLSGRKIEPARRIALAEKLESLALELDHIEAIAAAQNATDLADAIVVVSLVDQEGTPIRGVEQVAGMVRQFAERHRVTVEFLAERVEEKTDQVCFQVIGLGAYALLRFEAGLHSLSQRVRQTMPRNGREKIVEHRELIRVDVHPMITEPDKKFTAAVSSTVAPLKPSRSRLLAASWQVRVFHAPSVRALETCVGGSKAEALQRALLVLHAQVQDETSAQPAEIIRQYDLGIGSTIKDTRTGRSTTRIAQVFKGQIGFFRETEKH